MRSISSRRRRTAISRRSDAGRSRATRCPRTSRRRPSSVRRVPRRRLSCAANARRTSDDMRYALISDIHANLAALDAVLADIDRRGDVDAIYHLGDLVGYSADPNEVVSRLRERAIAGVAGNYDSTVATRYAHCGCRSESPRQEELAQLSYQYTFDATTSETKRFLGGLPFSLDL